jgi:hypothetical protein
MGTVDLEPIGRIPLGYLLVALLVVVIVVNAILAVRR